MIKAAFGDNSLWVCGHSGRGPKGQDIVCAAGSGGDMMEPARQGLLLLARHYGDNVEVRDLRTGRERHA